MFVQNKRIGDGVNNIIIWGAGFKKQDDISRFMKFTDLIEKNNYFLYYIGNKKLDELDVPKNNLLQRYQFTLETNWRDIIDYVDNL